MEGTIHGTRMSEKNIHQRSEAKPEELHNNCFSFILFDLVFLSRHLKAALFTLYVSIYLFLFSMNKSIFNREYLGNTVQIYRKKIIYSHFYLLL